jgi:hypothetical protein
LLEPEPKFRLDTGNVNSSFVKPQQFSVATQKDVAPCGTGSTILVNSHKMLSGMGPSAPFQAVLRIRDVYPGSRIRIPDPT